MIKNNIEYYVSLSTKDIIGSEKFFKEEIS